MHGGTAPSVVEAPCAHDKSQAGVPHMIISDCCKFTLKLTAPMHYHGNPYLASLPPCLFLSPNQCCNLPRFNPSGQQPTLLSSFPPVENTTRYSWRDGCRSRFSLSCHLVATQGIRFPVFLLEAAHHSQSSRHSSSCSPPTCCSNPP